MVLEDRNTPAIITIEEYSEKVLSYTHCLPEDLPHYHIVHPHEEPQSIFQTRDTIYDTIVARSVQLYLGEDPFLNRVTILDSLKQTRTAVSHYKGPVTINVLSSRDKCHACLRNESKFSPLKQCAFCHGKFCRYCLSEMNLTHVCFGSIRSQAHTFDEIDI